ncbi:aspartate--tRNA ligase [Candidatus Gottesmanbacteria bacterium]|nr:aspartate--tRNA ligase [Candidatus Gottesmanbacteria bacterium]
MKRTLASETVKQLGEKVSLSGFVGGRRDHGKIVFLDLRDRSGVVQLVIAKDLIDVRNEDVIEATGVVQKRPEAMINPKLATGTIEVALESMTLLSKSRELPLPIDTDGYEINEEVRLKYRYLDLRRPRLQKNIKLRSALVDRIRQFLFSKDFTEIETPLLTKSTPEGSRDFLVPSRMQPGKFYALPQSPQQYKQLLMAAGFERYFQIARCLRDEDLRADRGFEHTQVDIEMSFVEREDVMALDEEMITTVVESLGYKIKEKPFPVFTYEESMKRFGADKFDLRMDEDKKKGILAFAWVVDFPFFEKTDQPADGSKEGWTFTHNPFSMPKKEHKEWLLSKKNIDKILTTQYDLVCNGYEVGGGSIRGHEPEILHAVFSVMGYEDKKIEEQFGHMLQAFRYGVPPHGGLAHGIERLLMTLTGEPYLREVVAFPMTSGGQTSIMDAPSFVADEQLAELGIQTFSESHSSSLYEKIITLLESAKVSYEQTEHERVVTSEDAARVRNAPLSEGAKALIFYEDESPVMLVIAADLKVDTKLVKSLHGIKNLRMATPVEVKKVSGVDIGAVPPFGNLFRIPVYMDEGLRRNDMIVFNAGLHTKSVRMKERDYESLVKPVVELFSKNVNPE